MRSALRTTGAASLRSVRGSSKVIGSVRFMGGKELKFGIEGRAAMLKGVDLLADAVQVSKLWWDRNLRDSLSRLCQY